MLKHRLQFLLSGDQLFLHDLGQRDILVKQQQGEIHLIDTLADGIEVDCGLGSFHVTLSPCDSCLAADGASVIERLVQVDAHTVLVLLQPLEVNAHLVEHRLHLLGPCRHVALQCRLGASSDLRQPCLADVGYGIVGRPGDEVILLDERIVALGSLLTFFQGLCRASKRHECDNDE